MAWMLGIMYPVCMFINTAMKKILIGIVLLLALFVSGHVVLAQANDTGDATIDALAKKEDITTGLNEIFKSQNINTIANIDCSKITDDEYRAVGDGYMSTFFADPKEHADFHTKLGGELSPEVQTMHLNLGRAYLGCWANFHSGPVFMPMMGGVMGSALYPAYGKMQLSLLLGNGTYSGFSIFGWVTIILSWILLVLGIIALGKYLTKKK